MKVYVVIEEDRGLGPLVLAVFKSEAEAIAFAKKHSRCEVQSADILD